MREGQRVAVVIPNIDSPWLGDIVRTVFGQKPADYHLEVVVSGLDLAGGTIGTEARLVSNGCRMSAAAARNAGVAASTSDLLLFLDSDCLPEPEWLPAMLRSMADERKVIGGAIRIGDTGFLVSAGNVASFHEFTSSLRAESRPYLASFSLGLTRHAFQTVGGFDERYHGSGGEDLDFTIRLKRAGLRLAFEPSAAVTHHPARSDLSSIWRHAVRAGRSSVLVRTEYPEVFKVPRWLFQWPVMFMLAPILAVAVATRAFIRNPDVRKHCNVFPLIIFSRLAWAIGAALELRDRRQSTGSKTA
jgi:cellulose synthase/poly-beta-1,6-N-acetylglucosamine synthase-like glycosyltransferase